ncbi:50S ribosomal protein L18 [bacterium]|nr:50S ribosomal protein L18 [bacterium]
MSDKNINKFNARMRRRKHIRKRVFGTQDRPRLVVYRSLKNIYAQLIDDDAGVTLLACSNRDADIKERLNESKTKVQTSFIVGQIMGEKAKDKGIIRVVFDRNGYKYHGRVKAAADGARKSGLEF